MHNVRKLNDSINMVGASDRRLALFENVHPIPDGMAYNSYFVADEKTVVLDAIDSTCADVYFENLAHCLGGRALDYIIINHVEPDHCACLDELILRYPDIKMVCNAKAASMLKQFFTFDVDTRAHIVAEGDELSIGTHTFKFFMAPMVHWPEAMVTYEISTKTLFSADAFGTFGATGGAIFADELNFETEWLDDARRYYANIVGKYGPQVLALLKKAATLDIRMICPLHGPVWRNNFKYIIDKYKLWASYTPETAGVLIPYASIYGGTKNAAEVLAARLVELGVKNVKLYDVSCTHVSYLVAKAFEYSHIVFASVTYNMGVFASMENLLHELAAHNLQNRTVAFVENGSWAPAAKNAMANIVSGMKNMTVLESFVSVKSRVNDETLEKLHTLAQDVYASYSDYVKGLQDAAQCEDEVDATTLFKIPYGLYVVAAREGDKDNGCIINTVQQVTNTPNRISVVICKQNYTHDIVLNTGKFNVLTLSQAAGFDIFERFGFNSGRDTDKFDGIDFDRAQNGIAVLKDCINSVICADVVDVVDLYTHTMFVATISEARIINDESTVTYDYYLNNIKPKPESKAGDKKGFVCKICGWVYEGETLPKDIVCPLCKHGYSDFEPL